MKKFLGYNGKSVVFADINNIADTLAFSTGLGSVSSTATGRSIAINRIEVIAKKQVRVQPAGCADACDALATTPRIRLELSDGALPEAEILAYLDGFINDVKTAVKNGLLKQFKPTPNDTFDGTVVTG